MKSSKALVPYSLILLLSIFLIAAIQVRYTEKSAEKADIANKIGTKEGIDRFVEFTSPQDLLGTVNELLKG